MLLTGTHAHWLRLFPAPQHSLLRVDAIAPSFWKQWKQVLNPDTVFTRTCPMTSCGRAPSLKGPITAPERLAHSPNCSAAAAGSHTE